MVALWARKRILNSRSTIDSSSSVTHLLEDPSLVQSTRDKRLDGDLHQWQSIDDVGNGNRYVPEFPPWREM